MVNINDLEAGRELNLLIHRYLYGKQHNNEVMECSTSPKFALEVLSNIMQCADVLISSPETDYFECAAFDHKVGDSDIQVAICKCALMVLHLEELVDMSADINFDGLQEAE